MPLLCNQRDFGGRWQRQREALPRRRHIAAPEEKGGDRYVGEVGRVLADIEKAWDAAGLDAAFIVGVGVEKYPVPVL
jgi:hypothetical protein